VKVTIGAWYDTHYLNLRPVLDCIGDNSWIWRLEEFEGQTLPGSDFSFARIQDLIARNGFVELQWEQLLVWADHLHQMEHGYLSARESPEADQTAFTLEASDSSEWIAEAPRGDAATREILGRIEALGRVTGRGLSIRSAADPDVVRQPQKRLRDDCALEVTHHGPHEAANLIRDINAT
jgi:hypothetical protein